MSVRWLALVLLVGCGGGDPPADDATDPSGNTSEPPGGDDVDLPSTDSDDTPTFESDIVPLLYRTCGADENSCHSSVAYGADANNGCRGWLALEDVPLGSVLPDGGSTGCVDRELYDRLTELTAWQCYVNGWSGNGNVGFDIAYVTPGSLEDSYVWQKVAGNLRCDLSAGEPSQPMPLTSDMPAADLAMLEAWILAGAPRDAEPTVPATGEPPSCAIGAAPTELGYLVELELVATATDPEDGALTGPSIVWTSDLAGTLGTGSPLAVALGEPGLHTVTCTATDSTGATGEASVTIEAVSPSVWVWHPSDGEVRYVSNGPFPFIVDAIDLEDGDVSASVVWESDLDGIFGGGREVSWLPTAGVHVITATATDGDGIARSDSVTITMEP